jgi:hypothetical protein
MNRPAASLAITVVLAVSACTGSDIEEPIPVANSVATTTITPSSPEPANSDLVVQSSTTTASSSSTTVSPTAVRFEALNDIETASSWPLGVTVWDASGARSRGITPGFSDVIGGPLVNVIQVPLEGWVYQREQYSSVIHFDDGTGERELLVATGDQELLLEGVRLLPDDTAEVVYQRRDPDGQETVETLRAYNYRTAEVREITVTGGFESSTSFSTISGRYAVGLFRGEGHFELTTIDLDSGERPYSTAVQDFDCFDGGDAGCPHYEEALMIENYVYGFRMWSAGGTIECGLYRFDLRDNNETLIWALAADQGVYPRDLVQVGDLLALSLSSTSSYDDFSNALPAVFYDMSTGKTQLAPDPGFVQLGFIT